MYELCQILLAHQHRWIQNQSQPLLLFARPLAFFKLTVRKMPTAVYDASLVTRRARNNTLVTWYFANNTAVRNGTSVRREQPDTQLQEIVTFRNETTANTNPVATTTNTCPCTSTVDFNAGGNNGNTVE
jgi:hypothetical protein